MTRPSSVDIKYIAHTHTHAHTGESNQYNVKKCTICLLRLSATSIKSLHNDVLVMLLMLLLFLALQWPIRIHCRGLLFILPLICFIVFCVYTMLLNNVMQLAILFLPFIASYYYF